MNFQQYDIRLEKKDFFPKIFLKPQEIKLDKQKGLAVIKRTQDHPDKFQEEDIMDIQTNPDLLETEKKNNPAGHGLLSLFKKTNSRKIRLAICVSVFSEAKHMLKTTIRGIQESYKHFFQKAGIMSHEIILVCIFDGIQKINSSRDQTQNMISYFNQFDYKNGFKQQPYSKQIGDYQKYMPEDDDISIFTEEELQQLKPKLFDTQYQNYTKFKKLLSDIESIYKKKEMKQINQIKLDDLPAEVLKRYQRLCNNYVVYNNINLPNVNDLFQEIQDYFSHRKDKRLKLILQAIKQVELLCVQYLKSRQDTSILYPLRIQASDLDNSRSNQTQKQVGNQAQKPPEYNYMFFCVKHKNAGKLSSHLLFFEGFCKVFDPEFCILLDVGLMPQKDAIYRMWNYMEKNPQCGGVCGYMGLKIQNPSDDYGYRLDGFQINELDHLTKTADIFIDLQRAQQFQYHFAHMLDKPSEAAFNYIHVLPGAFSGYRCKALKSIPYGATQSMQAFQVDDARSQRPLSGGSQVTQNAILIQKLPKKSTIMSKYLKTAMNQDVHLTLQQSNMYLAEDRIMCLGIHALGYDLAYLPDAQSIVDPVTSLTRMMGQRKRWINGSWFAFQYVFGHKNQRFTFLFFVQLLHYWLVEKVSYISISIFYICLNLTVTATVRQYVVPAVMRFFGAVNDWELAHYKIGIFDVKSVAQSIPHIINFVYLMCIGALFFLSLSLNHANKRFSRIYYYISSLLGFYGLAMLALLIYNAYEIISGMVNRSPSSEFIIPILYYKILILFVIVGHAIPIIWTFSFRKYFQMILSLLSYLFYTPTYIHVLNIFSFCRIDDLAWGTKGLDQDQERQKAEDWKIKKLIFVSKYLFINLILGYVVMEVIHFQTVKNIVILVVTCLVCFLLIWRLFFASIYLVKYQFKKCSLRFSTETINQNIRRGSQVLAGLNTIQRRIREIEKNQTKIKKEIQLKDILDRSKIGNKVQGKILAYISDNNMVPAKEMTQRNPKYKSRRKIVPLKKRLKTIQELSDESGSVQNSIKQRDSRERHTQDIGNRFQKDVMSNGDSEWSDYNQSPEQKHVRFQDVNYSYSSSKQRETLVPSVPKLSSGSQNVDLKTKIQRIKSMKKKRKQRLQSIKQQKDGQ